MLLASSGTADRSGLLASSGTAIALQSTAGHRHCYMDPINLLSTTASVLGGLILLLPHPWGKRAALAPEFVSPCDTPAMIVQLSSKYTFINIALRDDCTAAEAAYSTIQ